MLLWIKHLPCKQGVGGSIPSFSILSDESLSDAVAPSHMAIAVGGTLNTRKQKFLYLAVLISNS